MPVFYQRTDGSRFYAKACGLGCIFTFQLTMRGAARLREAGVEVEAELASFTPALLSKAFKGEL